MELLEDDQIVDADQFEIEGIQSDFHDSDEEFFVANGDAEIANEDAKEDANEDVNETSKAECPEGDDDGNILDRGSKSHNTRKCFQK